MSEIQLITLTSFITALFGIFGALIGYIIISFVIEPIKELPLALSRFRLEQYSPEGQN